MSGALASIGGTVITFSDITPLTRAKTADSIGLAIRELATNALKYGALSGHGGRIDVSWRNEGADTDPRLRLKWRESGVRIAGMAPRRRGFGSELIERTLHYELDAETDLQFTPGGIRCVIELPLNDQNATFSSLSRRDQRGMEDDYDKRDQQQS